LESTGERGKIHLSQEAADHLKAAGKGSWLVPRQDVVRAKGKGELKTFWLRVGPSGRATSESSHSDAPRETTSWRIGHIVPPEKTSRLLQWNVDVLMTLLSNIATDRNGAMAGLPGLKETGQQGETTVLEEVEEIITLRDRAPHKNRDSGSNKIEPTVREQLIT
jgi:hypothetical protein